MHDEQWVRAKLATLEQQKEQLVADLNAHIGAIANCRELLNDSPAVAPATPAAEPPKKDA